MHHVAQKKRRYGPPASFGGTSPRKRASSTDGATLPTVGGPGSSGHWTGSGAGTSVSRRRSDRRSTSSAAGFPILDVIVHSRICPGSVKWLLGGPSTTS